MNHIIKEWRLKPHGSIPISHLSQIDTLLFADDIVFMATSEDNLQRLVYNFNQMAESFNMEISTDKSKVMAFLGKEPVRSKICINNKIIEQVKNFSYLGYQISYEEEKDLNEKIIKFNRAMGIINQIFKPTLVQKHTRTRIYKTLARPILCFGSEAWTIRNIDSQRLTAAEMRFMRRTAGYTRMDHIKNFDIMKELQIEPITEYLQKYRQNWRSHVIRMPRSRIPRQILNYHPVGKRSLGRPFKRWQETVTGH